MVTLLSAVFCMVFQLVYCIFGLFLFCLWLCSLRPRLYLALTCFGPSQVDKWKYRYPRRSKGHTEVRSLRSHSVGVWVAYGHIILAVCPGPHWRTWHPLRKYTWNPLSHFHLVHCNADYMFALLTAKISSRCLWTWFEQISPCNQKLQRKVLKGPVCRI